LIDYQASSELRVVKVFPWLPFFWLILAGWVDEESTSLRLVLYNQKILRYFHKIYAIIIPSV